MPSNVQLDAGAGGAIALTKQVTHDGDTTQCQGVHIMGIAGTEDSYTAAAINGDATNGLDVDVTRVLPGSTATALGKLEDTAHASGDLGVLMLAVRRDTPAVGSGTDGDNSTINVDASGYVYVRDVNTDAIAASLSILDDWDETNRCAVNLIAGQAGVAAGAGAVGATVIRVTLASDDPAVAALQILDNAIAGTEMQVDVVGALPAGANTIGSIASITTGVTPGTGATSLGKAEDDAHASGDVGVLMLAVRRDSPAVGSGTDGDNSTLNVNATGELRVTLSALPASTNTIEVVGDVAHDAAVGGNPVLVGFEARTTVPTAVANGDAVRAMADDCGRQVVTAESPRDGVAHARLALTSTTETTLIAAGGAGVLRDLVELVMSNESATECRVDIRDATGGTVRYSIDLAADGGGAVAVLRIPTPQATANNNWTAQLSAAVSTVYITGKTVDRN